MQNEMQWEKLLLSKRLIKNEFRDSQAQYPERSEFERDFDRIIFSTPFRRLQNKTQVLPLPQNDFVHNRLTHSLECASVGRSLGKIAGYHIIQKERELFYRLNITANDFGDIVSSACLAHDIGNPPFGHLGEEAIGDFFANNPYGAELIRDMGEKEQADLLSYEGNAEGFRVLVSLQGGLELTGATLSAFMKYPQESFKRDKTKAKRADQKKFSVFQSEKEILKKVADESGLIFIERKDGGLSFARNPLAFLVEAADDICYSIIDMEDGLKLGYIAMDEVEDDLIEIIKSKNTEKENFDMEKYRSLQSNDKKVAYLRAKAIDSLISQCASVFMNKEKEIMRGAFDKSLIDLTDANRFVEKILDVTIRKVYNLRAALGIELAGFKIITGLLESFAPILLRNETKKNENLLKMVPTQFNLKDGSIYDRVMNLTDFIAGMTDSYAMSLYKTLTGISLPETY